MKTKVLKTHRIPLKDIIDHLDTAAVFYEETANAMADDHAAKPDFLKKRDDAAALADVLANGDRWDGAFRYDPVSDEGAVLVVEVTTEEYQQ